MQRREFNGVLAAAIAAPGSVFGASSWSLTADVAECCSCEIPCPCNFGRPTKMRCDGNRLIEVAEGHVDDMDLAGVRFLVTFEMGVWTRIYADEQMSDAQFAAFEAIMPRGFGYFDRQAQSVERVPLSVTRTPGLVTFTTPASSVEMKPIPGLDGERIVIKGLPSNAFHDYIQYESVRHVHEGPGRQWSYSGTNGFLSRMIASG